MRHICSKLRDCYGEPRFGNPAEPLDDLIYIILSNRTSPDAAAATYNELKARFPDWADLLKAPSGTLRTLLRPLGLWTIRAAQIRSLLRQIRRDFGRCDLNVIRSWPDDRVHAYLVSLPGVSDKVAKCVMMYTLDREVLPVDVHVHRVASRLGWVARPRADQCHPELEALVPASYRFAFHVACIAHGRAVCRATAPRCDRCAINKDCAYAQRRHEVMHHG